MCGPTTAATEKKMKSFYQDLSRAVKQVPKGGVLLVMFLEITSTGQTPQSILMCDRSNNVKSPKGVAFWGWKTKTLN